MEINMYLGCKFNLDFNKLWLEGMKDGEGQLSERMKKDEEEEKFWRDFFNKNRKGALGDKEIAPLRERLVGLLNKDYNVLEIGPGWGNYSYAIAEKVKKLTCIDISKAVINFVGTEGEKRNIFNMEFIHSKFEDFHAKDSYDVVLGVNCFYRMKDMKSVIQKMTSYGKKLRIIGMTSGPDRQHYLELHEKFGYEIDSPRRDYIHIYNILYEMGLFPNVEVVDLKRDFVYESHEELIKDNVKKILGKYDLKEVEKSILKRVKINDGKYVYAHEFKGILIYW
ncbi:class I SAM-dependent methyltransferase [Clostridium amazonitimonense]|uniref:class I SAM-dependent methyltransferase n=1 Tax=Clostridium amazonitimonense TaxID=1499689 RepID=UPI00068C54D1|nr:methyltransferase domain-containing protein [Clostridium amazonitimonense]